MPPQQPQQPPNPGPNQPTPNDQQPSAPVQQPAADPNYPQPTRPPQNPQAAEPAPNNRPLSPPNRNNQPGKDRPRNQRPEKKSQANTTQKSLLISEIRDGIVIMQDGSVRSVVLCQSINFDLMSQQEREGVEFSYQQFLNSLYFNVQIYIRSQHIDLGEYLDKLEKTRENQDNILLGLLMEDYIAYVRYLIESANIMDKQFYVVVPYYPNILQSSEGITSGAKKFSELLKPKQEDVVTVNEVDFRNYKQELRQRVQVVVNGLTQMGIQAIPLNTQELIELYYKVYNPATSKQQQLADVQQLEAPIVEKGEGEANQNLPGEAK